jgi:hypothetical protein
MKPMNEPTDQKEKQKSALASKIAGIRTRLEELKKVHIKKEDFKSLKDELIETDKLREQIKEDDFSFLKDELDEIGKLKDQIKEEDFKISDSSQKGSEDQVSILRGEIGILKETVRRLAVMSFLSEEIENIRIRLGGLKVKKEDFNSLEFELNEKKNRLDQFEDEDDSQLFILRREIGMLREYVEALTIKPRFWSQIPPSGWIALVTLPLILYFAWLSFVQWRNLDKIYDYPATQTAIASQTMTPSVTETVTPTPSQIP